MPQQGGGGGRGGAGGFSGSYKIHHHEEDVDTVGEFHHASAPNDDNAGDAQKPQPGSTAGGMFANGPQGALPFL